MISPVSYKINNYQYQQNSIHKSNQTFTGFSPLKNYMDKTVGRFNVMSKYRWHDVDDDLKVGLKIISEKIGDKIFNAWDLNPNNSKKYIMFFHGMGQNISSNQPLYRKMIEKGFGVLSCEYGGFGENTDMISKAAIKNTVKQSLQYLKNKDINDVGVTGYSMGSFPAIETASQNPNTKFLVLIAPFNSLKTEVSNIIQWNIIRMPKIIKFLLKKFPFLLNSLDRTFKTQKRLANIDTPTFLIRATGDRVVSQKSTKGLICSAKNLKSFIELQEGGHSMDDAKLSAFSNLPLENF